MIGVDGSGKSTAVATMRSWLGAEIDTMPIYFGTGDGRPSLLLWPLKLLMPVFSRAVKTKPKGSSHGKVSDRPPGLAYSALLTVWAMVVAHEKRNKLVAARRAANRGLVVLADRYPQDEILGFNDGPLLARLAKVPSWLRRLEAGAYALTRRLPPDLVIKLKVLPETAAKREPQMGIELIRDRVASMERLVFPGARVVSVDAEQPLVDVIGKIKREIWRQL
jgi:thymidylate kinase